MVSNNQKYKLAWLYWMWTFHETNELIDFLCHIFRAFIVNFMFTYSFGSIKQYNVVSVSVLTQSCVIGLLEVYRMVGF